MGKKLGRREFVKGAAVAIAGAAIGSGFDNLGASPAAAEDLDPEPAQVQEEKAAEFGRVIGQLSLDEFAKLPQEMRAVGLAALKLALRDEARRDLLWCGRYPIVPGSEIFPEYEPGARDECRGKSKAEIVSMLDDLDDEDLFAVNALVGRLACV